MLAGTSRTVSSSFAERPQEGVTEASYPTKSEWLTVAVVLALFIAICACIQGRYLPWGDEVQFVDPAANLYYKLGFVSRQHSNQTDATFWAGNVPGYSALLYICFSIFHFSQTVARLLNSMTMALAAFVLWCAVSRARFLSQPKTRLLMLALVLTGYSSYYCYSNIRYDGLGFLQFALAFLAFTLTKNVLRDVCLFAIGAVMVLTNLQMPQYASLLILILTYAYSLRFSLIWRLRFLFLGFVAGGASVFLLYASHPGSLNAFYVTLQQQAGQSLWEKLHDFHHYFEYDASLATLFLFLLASLAIVGSRPQPHIRPSIIAGLLFCTVIPVFFFLVRRFVSSSAWMVYIPAVVCVCIVLEARINTSRTWKTFAAICCVACIGFGLPKALIGIGNDWAIRNYAVVDAFVAGSVGAKDIVFCDPAAYFAARPRAARVYGPGYLEVMSAAEKSAITVVIVAPANQADVTRSLGGNWVITRQLVRDSKLNPQKVLPLSTNFSCRLNVLRKM